jgi:hypothetical protein
MKNIPTQTVIATKKGVGDYCLDPKKVIVGEDKMQRVFEYYVIKNVHNLRKKQKFGLHQAFTKYIPNIELV